MNCLAVTTERASLNLLTLVLLLMLFALGCGSRTQSNESAIQNTAGDIRSQPVTHGGEGARDNADSENSGDSQQNVRPEKPSTFPLALSEPPEPSAKFNDRDLSNESAGLLAAVARQMVAAGKYDDAAQLQYWSVENGDGSRGKYNLACYLSLANQIDASFYWLQVAARDEGVDPAWALKDSDLNNLRGDQRWTKVHQFLEDCGNYWGTSGHREVSVVTPDGYDGSAIPVVVGLHGMGGRARSFVDADPYQEWANRLQVAFVGISGTIPRGPGSFVWSEDPKRDAAHVQTALQSCDKLKVKPGATILFGFSQGAAMSAEIAARNPEEYAGAILMSPGGNEDVRIGSIQQSPAHKRQGYVTLCGGGEHPGNVQMTKDYADRLRQLGARVWQRMDPRQDQHSFPSDYILQMPAWLQFVADPNASQMVLNEAK